MSEPELKAIPTLFNGVQYRSRLEADTAMLLDKLRIAHAYEQTSYLLKNGSHFRPDFTLYTGLGILEVRGYLNKKGNKQIFGFCDEVYQGLHGDLAFFVLSDGEYQIPQYASYVGSGPFFHSAQIRPNWEFGRCFSCGRWTPTSGLQSPCLSCGTYMHPPYDHFEAAVNCGVLSLLDPKTMDYHRCSDSDPMDFVWRLGAA
jgi:hypothetical protein